MVRSFCVVSLVLALGCTGPASLASAQSRPASRGAQSIDARVRELLSGIEEAPTREELLALGQDALDTLVRIQRDPAEQGVLRLRAITCASWFPGTRSRGFLTELLGRRGLEPLQLRAAIRGLGAQLGREGLPDASSLEPILSHARHDDPVVREAVLVTLIELRAQAPATARASIEQTLERLLAAETDADLVRASRVRLAR